jgi:hypothetical protein
MSFSSCYHDYIPIQVSGYILLVGWPEKLQTRGYPKQCKHIWEPRSKRTPLSGGLLWLPLVVTKVTGVRRSCF